MRRQTAQLAAVAAGCGRFADTYNCIKTAFHDTDILADILAILAGRRRSCSGRDQWKALLETRSLIGVERTSIYSDVGNGVCVLTEQWACPVGELAGL